MLERVIALASLGLALAPLPRRWLVGLSATALGRQYGWLPRWLGWLPQIE